MNGLSAVVLAGGRTSAEWEARCGESSRALVPFHGKPMVAWVIDALKSSQCVDEIVVVGDIHETEGVRCVGAGATFLGSVQNGLKTVTGTRFLQVTADIPFLTPEAVRDFVSRADATLDIGYAIIPESACAEQFPTLKRTFVRLREGRFTGGNLGIVRCDYLRARMDRVEQAYAARKKPLRLASMLGSGMVARLLLGALAPQVISIEYAQTRVSRMLGGNLKAIVTEFAEIGADIDTMAHWEQAQKLPFPVAETRHSNGR